MLPRLDQSLFFGEQYQFVIYLSIFRSLLIIDYLIWSFFLLMSSMMLVILFYFGKNSTCQVRHDAIGAFPGEIGQAPINLRQYQKQSDSLLYNIHSYYI